MQRTATEYALLEMLIRRAGCIDVPLSGVRPAEVRSTHDRQSPSTGVFLRRSSARRGTHSSEARVRRRGRKGRNVGRNVKRRRNGRPEVERLRRDVTWGDRDRRRRDRGQWPGDPWREVRGGSRVVPTNRRRHLINRVSRLGSKHPAPERRLRLVRDGGLGLISDAGLCALLWWQAFPILAGLRYRRAASITQGCAGA